MANLICTDNLKWLQDHPADSFDMVITSPPYNIKIDYDCYQDDLNKADYWTAISQVITEAYRCTRPGGRLAINIMPNTQQNMPTHSLLTVLLEQLGAVWITEIVWDKGGVNRWFPRGTYGSAVKPWFQHSFEYIIVVGKQGTRREAPGPGDLTNDEYTKWTVPLWRLQPETRMQKHYGHPAMFPEALVERLLKLFSWPGDTVLDPWGGCGTTALVAERLGRTATSLEISTQYHQQAQQRLRQETQWQDLFSVES